MVCPSGLETSIRIGNRKSFEGTGPCGQAACFVRSITSLTTNLKPIKQENTMSKQRQADENNVATLAEDARALMAATADVAGDKVAEARNRLAAALDSGKALMGRVREKTVEHAK